MKKTLLILSLMSLLSCATTVEPPFGGTLQLRRGTPATGYRPFLGQDSISSSTQTFTLFFTVLADSTPLAGVPVYQAEGKTEFLVATTGSDGAAQIVLRNPYFGSGGMCAYHFSTYYRGAKTEADWWVVVK